MIGFGFLSTYPPTRCGLATFTSALASAIAEPGSPDSRVIRVDDLVPAGPATPGPGTIVVGDLRPGSVEGRSDAAARLNASDVVIVQHEYGIYGGADGDEILDLMNRLSVPAIVVFHTVLREPTAHQRWVLERVAGLASTVVVMTHTAGELLTRRYSVSPHKVHVIPHGVATWTTPTVRTHQERPVILTWGLIGPGKGIEWGIRALAELGDLEPRPIYRVIGQTHPKVLLDSGEAYRNGLQDLAAELGVAGDVEVDDRYRTTAELAALVTDASVVLLPYDSRDQATSGVLAEAVAAGKPVIATGFPHAIELLTHGAGIVVGHQNPGDIAHAIREILSRPGLGAQMHDAAIRESHDTSWSAVASAYRVLARDLLQERAA